MNLDIGLIPFLKINSKWLIHINVKYKTIKLLEDTKENTEMTLGVV